MKHNDKSSPTDASARLDALLSDFLNKDIVEPDESTLSVHATSMPLGDPFVADVTAKPKPQPDSRVPTPQQVAPVNRTEVWEAASKPARPLKLTHLPADQLEKNVNSILEASQGAGGGKKLLFSSLVAILL